MAGLGTQHVGCRLVLCHIDAGSSCIDKAVGGTYERYNEQITPSDTAIGQTRNSEKKQSRRNENSFACAGSDGRFPPERLERHSSSEDIWIVAAPEIPTRPKSIAQENRTQAQTGDHTELPGRRIARDEL